MSRSYIEHAIVVDQRALYSQSQGTDPLFRAQCKKLPAQMVHTVTTLRSNAPVTFSIEVMQ